MFVLIQNTKTREYYSGAQSWTSNQQAARQFGSTVDALECVQKDQLKGVQFLMKMGKPEFDVQLKLPERPETSV